MKEIKIYGEIVPFQDAWLEADGYCNLSIIQRQLNEAGGEDVNIRINSYGGDVDEGFAIYSEIRRYAKDHKAHITTTAEGRCASIATVIFLAGDKRVVNPYVEPFVHNAWTYAMGDAKEIQRIAVDLEKCNNKIADHYAAHTDLTKEEALILMEECTSISADECVKIRFATEKEEIFRPVALQKILNKSKTNIMSKKDKKSIWNKIQDFIKDEGIFNKVIYDASGAELDFYELEEDANPAIGDKARVDGKDADGEYTIPSEENPEEVTTYVFASGELTEIKEPEKEEEETEEENSEVSALRTENETLKAQLLEAQNSATEKETFINSLKEKNKSLKAVVAKIKSLESEEEIITGGKEKTPKEKQPTASLLGAAITNLTNKKKNGI